MKLRDYQIRAKDFWLEHKQAYLAIDMGLGKTTIILHTIIEAELPSLVVAPLEVAQNTWPDEIQDWDLVGELDYAVLHGANKVSKFKRKTQRLRLDIINYEGLKWLYTQLYNLYKAGKPLPYKALILDESTAIKDPKTQRFGIIEAMTDAFKYRVTLSGTPIGNSLKDLWAQYYFLDKGECLGKSYRDFEFRFFEQNQYNKYDWQLRPGAEDDIYRRIAPRTFRLFSDDYVSLPERIFHKIVVDLPSSLNQSYRSFEKDFLLCLETATIESFNQASLNSKLRQFVQGAIYENIDAKTRTTHILHAVKVDALRALVERLSGQGLLCLIQFKFEVDLIKQAFPNARFNVGETTQAQRQQNIKDWNARKVQLLVAHPKTISKGLNLQHGGHNICWFAPTYSLLDFLQTNKRLHRSGQKEVVKIYSISIRNTIDELVAKALTDKSMTQERLLTFLREETKKWLKQE